MIVAVATAAMAAMAPVAPIVARFIQVFVFVGLLEEFLFRGYLQSRLNQAWGRPARWWGVRVGVGLIAASILFGVTHSVFFAMTKGVAPPWPWAVWTAVGGFWLGFLRERRGGILAPAMLHAAIDAPTVFMTSL